MSQAFGRSTQVSAIAREKTSEMSRLGAEKCPHFRNSGSLFQSFLYAFRRGAGSCPHQGGVRNSEVSARRESTVICVYRDLN